MCENYDEIERELNGDECKESKKHNYDFCVVCNKEMLLDSQKIGFSLYEMWFM